MADEVHVHQTPGGSGGGGSAGWIVAILAVVVLALVAWLFFMRGGDTGTDLPEEVDVEVEVPATPEGGGN